MTTRRWSGSVGDGQWRFRNLYAGVGVAVREVQTQAGPADYVLFVSRQAVRVIEAKKAGTTLSGVEPQTLKDQANVTGSLPAFLGDLDRHRPDVGADTELVEQGHRGGKNSATLRGTRSSDRRRPVTVVMSRRWSTKSKSIWNAGPVGWGMSDVVRPRAET